MPSPTTVSAAGATTNSEGAAKPEAKEDHDTIRYGDTGFSYEAVFGPYLAGAATITIEDPYIRAQHQVQNLVRFCEAVLEVGETKKIHLVTSLEGDDDQATTEERFGQLRDSLEIQGIAFTWEFRDPLHDREGQLSNSWLIKIGRDLDYFMKPENWFTIGSNNMDYRPCLETKVDIFRK